MNTVYLKQFRRTQLRYASFISLVTVIPLVLAWCIGATVMC